MTVLTYCVKCNFIFAFTVQPQSGQFKIFLELPWTARITNFNLLGIYGSHSVVEGDEHTYMSLKNVFPATSKQRLYGNVMLDKSQCSAMDYFKNSFKASTVIYQTV